MNPRTAKLRMTHRPSYQTDKKIKMNYTNLFGTAKEGTSEEEARPHLISEFMLAAGERITWIEAYELWYGMRSTNNSKLPPLNESIHKSLHSIHSSRHILDGLSDEDDDEEKDNDADTAVLDIDEKKSGSKEQEQMLEEHKEKNECDNYTKLLENTGSLEDLEKNQAIIDTLTNKELVEIARAIKTTYNIRLSDDKAELKFITGSLLLLWSILSTLVVCGFIFPENEKLGTLSYPVFIEAFILFFAELLWECILSAIVLKFNIKINYTRKLGNLFKIPKYFVADLFPFYKSTATSLMTTLTLNQSMFCSMYYRKSRERVPFFSYVFLSQDRREDRPDTLIFQVTEDLLRFLIYIPFKLFIANKFSAPAIIFIPIAVNNIGDGLAEPIGVAFGKHKYTTTALYHQGKFFKSKFTRSYEGSACVFVTTLVVVAVNYGTFNLTQFLVTLFILPFLMTIAEAKAPHTNDGPFLALIGCSFLTLVLLYL